MICVLDREKELNETAIQEYKLGVPVVAQWLMNPTRNHEVGGYPWPYSVGSAFSVSVSCGVGRRRGLDPVLLWLWRRLAATAPLHP